MAVPLKSFVKRNHLKFPLVVQVQEGIYDDNELDSEVCDFSWGDYLQLLRLVQEVNVTFESFYDQPSHQGQIILPLDYDKILEVQSTYADGHVFPTAADVLKDSVMYVCPKRQFSVQDVKVKAGDRLKVIRKTVLPMGGEFLLCKLIKEEKNLLIPLDTKGDFVKRGGLVTCGLSDILERLPQRVRVLQDEGMKMRGLDHGIQGVPTDYSGDLFLSKVDFVEACMWGAPEKILKIPCSVEIYVKYTEGFESRFGNPRDLHQWMERLTQAVEQGGGAALSKFVVADGSTAVDLGLEMDTIFRIRGQELDKAVLVSSADKNMLIPTNFKGVFKVVSCSDTVSEEFNTAYDLWQSNYAEEVVVTKPYNIDNAGSAGDSLYINDKIKIHSKELLRVPRIGNVDEHEQVLLDRLFSLQGHVGLVKVPTYAQACFQTSEYGAVACSLIQILRSSKQSPITLSYFGYPQSGYSTGPSTDECLFQRNDKVTVYGLYEFNVIQVTPDDDDNNNSDSPLRAQTIPDYIPLQVRPLRPDLPGTESTAAKETSPDESVFIPPRKKVALLNADQFERILNEVTNNAPIYLETIVPETRPKLKQSRPLPETPDDDGYSRVINYRSSSQSSPESPQTSHHNSPQRPLPAPPMESPSKDTPPPSPTSPSSTHPNNNTEKRSKLAKVFRRLSRSKKD